MTREEHTNIIQQLMTMVLPEHQATASGLLSNLSTDYEETLTNSETLKTDNDTLKGNNEKLRQVNADLFLKVGTQAKPENLPPSPTDKGGEDIPTLSYDNLFNEKGDLL